MGLDQYAYVASKVGAKDDYYEEKYDRGNSNANQKDFYDELAYWRKHPNLHGWMESLWIEKGRPGVEPGYEDVMFNGVELELTFDDIVRLENDIKENKLPSTTGFFFGQDSDDYYKSQDLEFVYEAKTRLFLGQKVFYNSSW